MPLEKRPGGPQAADPSRPFAERPSFVLTLAMLTALSATTVDLSLPAQPLIASEFGARPEAGGVIVSAYLLGYGPGQVFWGPLSDRFGRMRPLTVGLVGFLLSTLACLFAHSLESLALARAVQGFFGASSPVIGRAIARDQGGGERTARLLGTLAVIFGAAPMLAPLLGSALLLWFHWSSQFWFLAGLALVLLAVSHAFVAPATRDPSGPGVPLGLYLARAGRLFRERDFLVGCGALVAAMSGYAPLLATGAAMTSTHYGLSPEAFGPLFAVATSSVIMGPLLGTRLLRVWPVVKVLRTGAAVSACAAVALVFMAGDVVPLRVLWPAVFAYVFGFGMVLPLANAVALEPAGEAAGVASSLLGALPTLAGAAAAGLASGPWFSSSYQAVCLIMAGGGAACFGVVWLARGRPAGT